VHNSLLYTRDSLWLSGFCCAVARVLCLVARVLLFDSGVCKDVLCGCSLWLLYSIVVARMFFVVAGAFGCSGWLQGCC